MKLFGETFVVRGLTGFGLSHNFKWIIRRAYESHSLPTIIYKRPNNE